MNKKWIWISNVESKLTWQGSKALLFSGRFSGGNHPQNMSRLKWHETIFLNVSKERKSFERTTEQKRFSHAPNS